MGDVKRFIFMLLTVSAIVIGFSTFYTDVASTYDTDVKDMQFVERSQQTLDLVNTMTTQTQVDSFSDAVGFMLTAALTTVQTVFTGLATIQAIFVDLVTVIGLPGWFANVVIAMIVISLAITILSIYLQRDI